MSETIAIVLGVIIGFHVCVYAKKSDIYIGRPYLNSDWWSVNAFGTFIVFLMMIAEWVIYASLLELFEETAVFLYLVRKGIFVPILAFAISFIWSWRVKKRFLDYSDGYSSRLGGLCLALIIGMICFNAQWFLLPTLEDGVFKEFVQDSVIAWFLVAFGTVFSLDFFCNSRKKDTTENKIRFRDFVFPIVTVLIISCSHLLVALLKIDYLIPPFVISISVSSVVFILLYLYMAFPSLKRLERRLRKCGEQSLKRRSYTGVYRTIQFHIGGEYLEILENRNVLYSGDNIDEFNRWFGYERQRLGKQVVYVEKYLTERRKQQRAFFETEARHITEHPEEYSREKERRPKGKV